VFPQTKLLYFIAMQTYKELIKLGHVQQFTHIVNSKVELMLHFRIFEKQFKQKKQKTKKNKKKQKKNIKVNFARFAELSEDDLASLLEGEDAVNTKKVVFINIVVILPYLLCI
jgi:hypothetical protein